MKVCTRSPLLRGRVVRKVYGIRFVRKYQVDPNLLEVEAQRHVFRPEQGHVEAAGSSVVLQAHRYVSRCEESAVNVNFAFLDRSRQIVPLHSVVALEQRLSADLRIRRV